MQTITLFQLFFFEIRRFFLISSAHFSELRANVFIWFSSLFFYWVQRFFIIKLYNFYSTFFHYFYQGFRGFFSSILKARFFFFCKRGFFTICYIAIATDIAIATNAAICHTYWSLYLRREAIIMAWYVTSCGIANSLLQTYFIIWPYFYKLILFNSTH